MTTRHVARSVLVLVAVLALVPTLSPVALAQAVDARPTQDPEALPDGAPPDAPFSLEASIAAVSDYRFRGVSLSNKRPALQAGLELSTRPGVYVGAWGSTIPDYNGAHAELDGYAGYRHAVSKWTLDIGAIGYFYPGGDDVNGFELYGSVSRDFAEATFKAGASYTPQQRNFGETDGAYVFAELTAELPRTPFTFRAHLGRETGVNGGPDGEKVDWLVGVDAAVSSTIASLAWVDTDVDSDTGGSAYRATLVASLSVAF